MLQHLERLHLNSDKCSVVLVLKLNFKVNWLINAESKNVLGTTQLITRARVVYTEYLSSVQQNVFEKLRATEGGKALSIITVPSANSAV